jgi:hypothetical protein
MNASAQRRSAGVLDCWSAAGRIPDSLPTLERQRIANTGVARPGNGVDKDLDACYLSFVDTAYQNNNRGCRKLRVRHDAAIESTNSTLHLSTFPPFHRRTAPPLP